LSNSTDIRKKLEARRDELEKRIERIDKDVRQVDGPLDPDSGEQSLELANDEVLDGIDSVTRMELEAIHRTLGRVENGGFGICIKCNKEIPVKRLEALPHSEQCVTCADEDDSGYPSSNF
jgi:RNA polymerase-binding transcription factor DksA